MKALLSIKQEYVEQIFNGTKYYEYRRSIFKKPVDSIVVYCTSPIMKVIGEFKVSRVVNDTPINLWNLAPEHTGIAKDKFLKYFEGKEKGYAIEIGELNKYEIPSTLEEIGVKRAPQSFTYVE